MKKGFNKGFTLIELLVVVAIIGILASVVLASLNSARSRGADAAVKSSLANARAQAELFYDTASNYTTVCTTGTSNISTIIAGAARNSADADQAASNDAAATATVGVCNDAAAGWAAEMPMKGGSWYCVDYTGKSQTNAAAGLAAGTDIDC